MVVSFMQQVVHSQTEDNVNDFICGCRSASPQRADSSAVCLVERPANSISLIVFRTKLSVGRVPPGNSSTFVRQQITDQIFPRLLAGSRCSVLPSEACGLLEKDYGLMGQMEARPEGFSSRRRPLKLQKKKD